METLLAALRAAGAVQTGSPAILTGTIAGITDNGQLLVQLAGGNGTVQCDVLMNGIENPPFAADDTVIVMVIAGADAPIVVGTVGRLVADERTRFTGELKFPTRLTAETVEITAQEQLTISCAEGSVLLQEDGTVVVRGARILSRAKGVNKIKGGSVQLN